MQDSFLSNIIFLIAAIIALAIGFILEKNGRKASMEENDTLAKRLFLSSNILCVLGIVLTASFMVALLVEESDPYTLCMMP